MKKIVHQVFRDEEPNIQKLQPYAPRVRKRKIYVHIRIKQDGTEASGGLARGALNGTGSHKTNRSGNKTKNGFSTAK